MSVIFDEDDDDVLQHYGVARRSGRYPWGSGENPRQSLSSRTFLDNVAELRKKGMSEAQIAQYNGMSTTELRALKSMALAEQKASDIAQINRLQDKGLSTMEIGRRMNMNESTVRSRLASSMKENADILQNVSDTLRKRVDEKEFIDVGVGVERHMGISQDRLKTAVAMLQAEGYEVHTVPIDQLGTGMITKTKILAPPGTTYRDIVSQKEKIHQITDYSEDNGRSFSAIQPPLVVHPNRVAVRYAEQGGKDADGVIYVRPGVNDLSLGGSHYAQIRIAVGEGQGTHYLKGMAMYKDDLPKGVDLMFNTNKSDTGNKLDAMKALKDDPENPFGSIVRQIGDRDASGNLKKVTSAMNIVNEEGQWGEWKKTISSQMLSKQSPTLAQRQLDLTFAQKKADLDEIMSLTNPAVKKKLLESYADDVDSSAVHLKAAHLPRQASHVILPINTLKETEIYAPNYRDGERVVLIRYPHGGKFEIPELTVNNRHPDAQKLIGRAPDAVGIHHKVAERLSGADFDGDTVLVIPNNSGAVKSESALSGLKNFDPQKSYPPYHGMKTVDGGVWNDHTKEVEFPPGKKPSSKTKNMQMGDVSNLITDMTIRGATNAELAQAVRHSMVVIDSEKHHLNYRESARANGIAQLKAKYQGKGTNPRAGASTIISSKKREIDVPEAKLRKQSKGGPIDKATGELVYEPTGATYVDRRTGKTKPVTMKVNQLAMTPNAHDLSSGTKMEQIYAEHSNRMKALANKARKEYVNTPPNPVSPSAKKHYSSEVAQLNAKLNIALKNAPLERQAQVLAGVKVAALRRANPEMDAAERKKVESLALVEARNRVGSVSGKERRIEITPREWEAIQAGAITNHKLEQILRNADLTAIRQMATPKSTVLMTSTKKARAQSMLAAGYTQAEVADALGFSLTTLKRGLSDG